MSLIHHHNCPACGSKDFREIFRVKDQTVSGDLFPICECGNCTLRFTQDIPDESTIGDYYRSTDYISHQEDAPGMINRIYKMVRRRTLRSKRILIEKVTRLQRGDLLDIGSGTGSFVNEMKKEGWAVTGLEPDEGARSAAKKNYQVILEPPGKLPEFADKSFDAITLWHVLEHVHALGDYLNILRRLLKENGRLFIALPNYTSKDATVYRENWAAYDVPRHLYHFSPKSLRLLLEKYQLSLVDEKPMWYDSFYISLLSSRYKNGRSNFPAAFFHGLRSNFKALGNVERCSSIIYIASSP